MKGLLLKDFYSTIKYGKTYFIILAIFAFISFMDEEVRVSYFLLYPCLLAALLPMTLLSYDERSKWNAYCGGLPVIKSEIVSSKYIMGLCFMILVLLVFCITNGIKMYTNGVFLTKKIFNLIAIMLTIFFAASLPIPLMYKFGAERGRVIYYIITFAIFTGLSIILGIWNSNGARDLSFLGNLSGFVPLIGAFLYLLTWRLSILLFERKEDV